MLKKTTALVVSGLNFVAVFAAATPMANAGTTVATPVATINQASLSSIEKSWLNLPRSCKARMAAFDPIVVGQEAIPSHVIVLYAQTVA